MQKRLTAHCSRNSLRNHSKSMLSEGTNGELHTVQVEVVLSVIAVLVLNEDVESESLVGDVVEEKEVEEEQERRETAEEETVEEGEVLKKENDEPDVNDQAKEEDTVIDIE